MIISNYQASAPTTNLLSWVDIPKSSFYYKPSKEKRGTRPIEYLCLDIRYVWVAGEYKNDYLLTVLDVFTCVAVEQIFQKSVRKIVVINVFRRINNKFGIKVVTIRNDNGSKFIANDIKQF